MTNTPQARDATAVQNYPDAAAVKDGSATSGDIPLFYEASKQPTVQATSTPSTAQQATNAIQQQNYDANKPDPNNWTRSKAVNGLNNVYVVPMAKMATVIDGAETLAAGYNALAAAGTEAATKIVATTDAAATEQALANTRAALGLPPDATVSSGGLNLFKFGAEQTTKSEGWVAGDRMLKMFDQGSPQLNWQQNSGFLRAEMRLGQPIFDSYRLPNGDLIPTGGFLNAERNLLQSNGWIYNPSQGAWIAPTN